MEGGREEENERREGRRKWRNIGGMGSGERGERE